MPEKNGQGEKPRIAVYVCHCGGNISDVVQCEKVAKALGEQPDVVVSRTNMSMCSDAAQTMIEEDIRELGINRVVIGACAPSLHEQTFRGTVSRAGLNPYLYYHVGLREQASWVHHHDSCGATDKAIRLMMAGIAKARLLKPLDSIKLDAERHTLVIGGGVAGLRCALDVARRGIKVTLLEKTPFLGGRMAQLESVFPTGKSGRELLDQLIHQVVNHPGITIYTRAELADVSGYVGYFNVQIKQQSRCITDNMAEAAMRACTQEVPDEFNYGLTKRKIIYQAYPGCYPQTPAVDWDNCPDERLKLDINGHQLILENNPKTFDLTVGAIVIATGFRPYEPRNGEYGYGQMPEVLTLPKFIRLLALQKGESHLTWNGHPVKRIAMIHCVGSRQIDGIHEPQADGQVNDYCSRVCCTATLHVANELREQFPDIHLFDVYEDIRTYGRGHEDYYIQASANRVRFVRFHADEMPEVVTASANDEHRVLVRVKDYLTAGQDIEIPVDMVVLAVGIMPNPVDDIIKMLKISPGTDRFLLEVHPKLRPVETAVPGILLAGTAQGPMNIQESCTAAAAAAAKVSALLARGLVELEPFVAAVNPEKCTGIGECLKACCYEEAIHLEVLSSNGRKKQRAVVTPANCAGCGSCVSACPNRAIDVQGWTLAQYDAMVEALTAEIPELEVAR